MNGFRVGRVARLAAATALVASSVVATHGPALAVSWSWDAEYDRYKDSRCGTSSDRFHVVLFSAPNYEGDRVLVCGNVADLDDVPRKQGQPASAYNWANVASSLRVKSMPAGYDIWLYMDPNYFITFLPGQTDDPSFPSVFDNDAESMERLPS